MRGGRPRIEWLPSVGVDEVGVKLGRSICSKGAVLGSVSRVHVCSLFSSPLLRMRWERALGRRCVAGFYTSVSNECSMCWEGCPNARMRLHARGRECAENSVVCVVDSTSRKRGVRRVGSFQCSGSAEGEIDSALVIRTIEDGLAYMACAISDRVGASGGWT